ncbi:O-antigen ligase family protein [Gelidibacter pelagius]|uniref:O-antigen ligase family protein n=1 Tax=Gelidibacter pelagius TaxID=2819985 RepID=A0ABS3SN54_9FLAO|nr:O-antigen ligase family protein [Gelidibacter pelagius]MBO3096741.1 O-antigen ligase family protein [Gelidibacter pelagius]
MINLTPKISTLKSIYLEKDFSFLAIAISLFLLPLSINLSTFALMVGLGLKLIQVLFLKQKFFVAKTLRVSSAIGVLFLLYVLLNCLIQNDLHYLIAIFGNEFSPWVLLILVPFILREKNQNIILSYAFFSGLIVACLYVLAMSFILRINFDRDAFQNIIDIHHTYLCMYLLFFVNFLLVRFFTKTKKNHYLKSISYLVVFSLVFLLIFILKSKVSIVIYALLVGGHLVVSFSKKNAVVYLFIVSALTLSIILFNQKLNTSYKNAMDFRLEIWDQSINSIKENLLFGNLKMQEKDLLNEKHYLNGRYDLMDSDLNSHNQYLSILLKYGIIGSIILTLYILNLIMAFNKTTPKETVKSVLGFSVIILTIFYIENILDRHHGIVFVTVFYNYYLVAVQNETN